MKKLQIKLDNCYGIKKLHHNFDFSKKSSFALYAPNGIMKTSFAKTLMDYSVNNETKDLVFGYKSTVREILNENDEPITKDSIFVIEPYNETYKSDKVSTLMANQFLREKYQSILEAIDNKKKNLIRELRAMVGFRNNADIEDAFSYDIARSKKAFLKAIMRLKDEVLDDTEMLFSNIKYTEIFNEKVLEFLKNNSVYLDEYIKRYEELISKSVYFKKGFNHNNATIIAKNLKENGFFYAQHSLLFNSLGGEKRQITTEEELKEVIQEEINTILKDKELLEAFEKIDNSLDNKTLKVFRDYLLNNLFILPELKDLEAFKGKLWLSYLKARKEQYKDLEEEYSKGRLEIERILQKAKEEIPEWLEVIRIFHSRFFVPFSIKIENQEDVVLRNETPNFAFYFEEENRTVTVEEQQLLQVLSNGEKRALYILNIIFEVEARKRNRQETLFVIDDIADSFDYKNKYAIIEYLKDISEIPFFKQIVLTHNFDFYRSISGRLDTSRAHRLHAIKNDSHIDLIEEKYQNNPFSHWKEKMHENNAMLVASIPFVRNIAEFAGNRDCYDKLTSLLHIKSNTYNILMSDLEMSHKSILLDKKDLNLSNPTKKVIDLIYETANSIETSLDRSELENKVVLSIAIRLKAEEFMIKEINDTAFCETITSQQTYKLYQKYKEKYPNRLMEIKLLDQVNLMTPENIHLNSFMYEPILDMSDLYLKKLYKEIKNI